MFSLRIVRTVLSPRLQLPRLRCHLEFLSSFLHPISVLAVHHIYEAICIVEVVPPEGPQLFLPPHVPDSEKHILVLHLLDIEACREGASVWVVQMI